MDVVVANVPPKFGMLLSRSWDSKLKGTLQMHMSYATIPVFGDQRRLYREKKLAYVVSNQNKSINNHVYAMDTDIGSSFFYYDDGPIETNVDNLTVNK